MNEVNVPNSAYAGGLPPTVRAAPATPGISTTAPEANVAELAKRVSEAAYLLADVRRVAADVNSRLRDAEKSYQEAAQMMVKAMTILQTADQDEKDRAY